MKEYQKANRYHERMYGSYVFSLRPGILALGLLILISGKAGARQNSHRIFHQVAQKLFTLKHISYRYAREFNYPSESYLSKSGGNMFVDFDKENDLVGFRFQYTSTDGFSIFNNEELFIGNSKTRTIKVIPAVEPAQFEGVSALFNSIVTLRNVLPLVINDGSIVKEIRDTVVENRSFYLLQFDLCNKLVNYLGTGFTATSSNITFRYKLVADKKTLLPVTLLQTKRGSPDFNRTDFSDIQVQSELPGEKSWYYSTYLNDYELDDRKTVSIIAPGEAAPDWTLPDLAGNTKETLSQHKGQVVLLEFWIKNCGYCIEAVKKLNDLYHAYKHSEFSLFAINTEDNSKAIDFFVRKYGVMYPVLLGDDPKIAAKYGITGFPQVVLIGKTGSVIYSGKLDISRLRTLIDQNL
ncbi:hypothetical protein C7T94_14175 [Pedobacter yulinensis]|uniref:Thioredoxin domain-containing protein n=1 Tax=Pedobacter yulinensis TaxID=2126353 RepID=A0A2T3HMK5_9SPHI|nr:TlpA disulfide reductase family protein [Pedobacter yulinensis]PST83675.1 hypothetical protein C7T94_14175 [Pedobacter yulinensis]